MYIVQCTSKFGSRECRMLTCAYFGWRISMMSDVVWSASTIGQLDMATSRCRVGIGPLWALEWEANSWLCTIAVLVSGTKFLYQAQKTCIRHIIIILCIVHTCIVHNYLDHIGFSEWLANSWSCRIPHWKREQVNTAGKYFHSHRILMTTLSNDVIQIRKEMVSGLQNLIG